MDPSDYYQSLIQQGYLPQQAEQYTAQQYPGFSLQSNMSNPPQANTEAQIEAEVARRVSERMSVMSAQATTPQQYIIGSAPVSYTHLTLPTIYSV